MTERKNTAVLHRTTMNPLQHLARRFSSCLLSVCLLWCSWSCGGSGRDTGPQDSTAPSDTAPSDTLAADQDGSTSDVVADTTNPDFGDCSYDADGFLWGTEAAVLTASFEPLPAEQQGQVDVVNNTLRTRYVKLRVNCSSPDAAGDFTPTACLFSGTCFDLDETARIFDANGWSMVPMLSFPSTDTDVQQGELDDCAHYIAWFVDRYVETANIEFLELTNYPGHSFHGTTAQLLAFSNLAYDLVKAQHPTVKVGTPGFEYWNEGTGVARSLEQVEHYLDPANGARFDFWAFHGYGMWQQDFSMKPPTATSETNPYASIPGILELRRKLDANGWTDRPILDTEHTGLVPPGPTLTDEMDALDAAYMVQELVLKRTLRDTNGAQALTGILPLKVIARGAMGERAFGSLTAAGQPSRALLAVALLLSKLNELPWAEHVSGAFGETEVWAERFGDARREMFVVFAPFETQPDGSLTLAQPTSSLTLQLRGLPVEATRTSLSGAVEPLPLSSSLVLDVGVEPAFLEVVY